MDEIKRIIEPTLYKDCNGIIYTTLSLRYISTRLENKGFKIKHTAVRDKLHLLGVKVKKNKLNIISTQQNPVDNNICIDNSIQEKPIFYSSFDPVVDHFLSSAPSWSYAEFDLVVDNFLSLESLDSVWKSDDSISDFDQIISYTTMLILFVNLFAYQMNLFKW